MNNAQGFYVNAPQRCQTDFQSLLAYIGRYMKRGPLALSRINTLSQKIVLAYQQKVRKILFNAKRMTREKIWRKLTLEQFTKDPLECPHCGNSYVFKGTVVRKNGKLKVGYANNKEAPDYLVKEIKRLEEETYQNEQKKS